MVLFAKLVVREKKNLVQLRGIECSIKIREAKILFLKNLPNSRIKINGKAVFLLGCVEKV